MGSGWRGAQGAKEVERQLSLCRVSSWKVSVVRKDWKVGAKEIAQARWAPEEVVVACPLETLMGEKPGWQKSNKKRWLKRPSLIMAVTMLTYRSRGISKKRVSRGGPYSERGEKLCPAEEQGAK